MLPEEDAAGRALEWHFHFADTNCSGRYGLPGTAGSCLPDPIPGAGADALELHADGSFTWAPGTDQAGMYATQIIAYEENARYDIPIRLYDPGGRGCQAGRVLLLGRGPSRWRDKSLGADFGCLAADGARISVFGLLAKAVQGVR